MCGKIIGYQQKTPDAFFRFINGQTTIDSNYVDGISLTHGSSPREHIWTFAAALQEDISDPGFYVPVQMSTTQVRQHRLPLWVRTTSVTQAAMISSSSSSMEMIVSGMCASSTCCFLNSPPWFLKELTPTSDDIEMRLCADQPRYDEDSTFEYICAVISFT